VSPSSPTATPRRPWRPTAPTGRTPEVRRGHARGPRDRPRRRNALLRFLLPGDMVQQPRRRGQSCPRRERGPRRRRRVRERRPARFRGAPQRRGRRALRVLRIVVDGGYKHAASISRCHAVGHGVPRRVRAVEDPRLEGRDCWRRLPLVWRRPCVSQDPVLRPQLARAGSRSSFVNPYGRTAVSSLRAVSLFRPFWSSLFFRRCRGFM
jgi:hypothetical protein